MTPFESPMPGYSVGLGLSPVLLAHVPETFALFAAAPAIAAVLHA